MNNDQAFSGLKNLYQIYQLEKVGEKKVFLIVNKCWCTRDDICEWLNSLLQQCTKHYNLYRAHLYSKTGLLEKYKKLKILDVQKIDH